MAPRIALLLSTHNLVENIANRALATLPRSAFATARRLSELLGGSRWSAVASSRGLKTAWVRELEAWVASSGTSGLGRPLRVQMGLFASK